MSLHSSGLALCSLKNINIQHADIKWSSGMEINPKIQHMLSVALIGIIWQRWILKFIHLVLTWCLTITEDSCTCSSDCLSRGCSLSVFSNPFSTHGSLHRFCPATGGSALRNSGPIRRLGSGQLAEAHRCRSNRAAGFVVRWRLRPAHSVLKQMKNKS